MEKCESRLKEAFGITVANTNRRRDTGKKRRYQKARFQPLEVGGRVLVRNLNESGPGNTRHFGNRKYIKFLKRKMRMV